jgi:hypothetical protein
MAKDANAVEFFQFSDDGESSQQLAGAFTVVAWSATEVRTTALPFDGTRSDNRLAITLRLLLGVTVNSSGEFDVFQTIQMTNASSGCVNSGEVVATSNQDYNASVDALRGSTPTPSNGPTGETCQSETTIDYIVEQVTGRGY